MQITEIYYPHRASVLDALCLEKDDIHQNDLGVDEVKIEVKSTVLSKVISHGRNHLKFPSFRDIMVAMGLIPNSLLGFNANGIIVREGNDVLRCRPSDAIYTLGHGSGQALPQDLFFEEATTLPSAHCTATYSLVYTARVHQCQSVLIYAGAGVVSQAVIKMAKRSEVEIFTTLGSTESVLSLSRRSWRLSPESDKSAGMLKCE